MALQSNLDPQKACGPDDIPTIVVKRCFMDQCYHCVSSLTPPYYWAGLPSEWETSFVVLVHKTLRQGKVETYRPISLLCIVSMVLELPYQ